MAHFDFVQGVAFGTQSAYGTINATTRDLTGALATANGIVLGDAEAGQGETGIDFDQERNEKPLAAVTGSFTKQAGSFLRIVPSLQIAVPLAGPRNNAANPVVDGDMSLATNWPGLDALLRAAGLVGAAWGGGVGFQFLPASAIPLTAKVWVGGSAADAFASSYVLQDCFADLDIQFTPGGIAVALFKIGGTRQGRNAGVTLPTFAYGTQASVSPPTVQNAAFTWGMARGFEDLKVSIVNGLQVFKDSNVPGGEVTRQSAREISIAGTIYSDSTDQDYEDTNLDASVAPTADASFTVGTAAVALGAVNAYYLALNNFQLTKNSARKIGTELARAVEGYCSGASANSEFELRFI